MNAKISNTNWNTAYYYSEDLIAFISLGGAPLPNIDEIVIQYYVTLSSKEYEDVYQSSHNDLESAISALNQRYGDWKLKYLGEGLDQEDSGSGCSTCAAH